MPPQPIPALLSFPLRSIHIATVSQAPSAEIGETPDCDKDCGTHPGTGTWAVTVWVDGTGVGGPHALKGMR